MEHDFFNKDAPQVIPRELVAFGMTLSSSRGKAAELAEMLIFAELAVNRGADKWLDGVLYNERGLCTFRFRRGYHPHTSNRKGIDIIETLDTIAGKTLSHYRLYGCTVERKNKHINAISDFMRTFLETVHYLDKLDEFGVNHYGKGRCDVIAINFPHLTRIAALHGVKLPVLTKVKDELNRLSVEKKPVRSALIRMPNSANPTPPVLRCWIIRAPYTIE